MTTAKALELSIQKWKDIRFKGKIDHSYYDCSLCQVYNKSYGSCSGCPVQKHTKQAYCRGTPYFFWDRHQKKKHKGKAKQVHCSVCKRFATQEIKFLESLRA